MRAAFSERRAVYAACWPAATRSADKAWRAQWDRLVDQFGDSDPLTLHRAVEQGVPAGTVALLSRALGEPVPQVLSLLGLAETTLRRTADAGEVLPEVAGHRAVALLRARGCP